MLTWAVRMLGLGMISVALAGCTLYWYKPGADMATFTTAHQECMKVSGTPVSEGQVYVNLDVYRACLRARGWSRESASTTQPPAYHYRGQENDGPVPVTSIPPQPAPYPPPR
jgi:hypothetical protein